MAWRTKLAWVLLCVGLGSVNVCAQTAPDLPVKEVEVAAGAFSRGDAIPSWVERVTMPEPDTSRPLVGRLADTQFLVGSTPIAYVHFALTVNDASMLTPAGQISIEFVPQYQRLQLHTIHVLRGAETLDQTTSSTVRFLQRDTDPEQSAYRDVLTASILVSDLRVGDTIEYAYSVLGDNPIFGGKFVEAASWDQSYPIMLRRVVLNHPVDRQVSWQMIGDAPTKVLVPAESIDGGMRKLRFEENDLAEVTVDGLTPPDYMPYRWLQFSEFSGWNDVVDWASGLFLTTNTIDAELRAVAETLQTRPNLLKPKYATSQLLLVKVLTARRSPISCSSGAMVTARTNRCSS